MSDERSADTSPDPSPSPLAEHAPAIAAACQPLARALSAYPGEAAQVESLRALLLALWPPAEAAGALSAAVAPLREGGWAAAWAGHLAFGLSSACFCGGGVSHTHAPLCLVDGGLTVA